MYQIVEEYSAGARQKDLADKYDIGVMSVKRILKSAGARRHPKAAARQSGTNL
ncbi:MAG: hypothetical protein ACRDXX_09375 [Stackebrandtia sp.]